MMRFWLKSGVSTTLPTASEELRAGAPATISNHGHIFAQLCVLTWGLLVIAGASLLALHVT